jgi:two-component system phosphate regulon sensor histidine kinase PhoR
MRFLPLILISTPLACFSDFFMQPSFRGVAVMVLGAPMADKRLDMQDGGERLRAREGVPARLASARWVLAASALGLLSLVFLAGLHPLGAVAAFAAVVAAAALAPAGQPDGETRRPLPSGAVAVDDLSALRLADAVADPLLVLDRAGVVVHANQAALGAFGTLQDVDLMLRFRAPEMQALLGGVLEGRSGAADYLERLPLERLYRVTATPVGAGTGLSVVTFRDQSEVRRIDRMRADFIANASHELRTPLASIAGFVETLRGPARDDPAARDRFLGIMQAQTERMARLIDDLLSLSRLEMKPFVKPGEKVELVATLSSVADALGRMAAEAGVAIELDLPPAPVEVPGNRDELIQVFENLLENAIKYGRSGKRVAVSIARDDSGARPEMVVNVRDFGPGIPAEHIPRVTERFYRVEPEAGQSQKGTGLGLAIVKHILTRHNARLVIRSQPGQGAEFTVHLPA